MVGEDSCLGNDFLSDESRHEYVEAVENRGIGCG